MIKFQLILSVALFLKRIQQIFRMQKKSKQQIREELLIIGQLSYKNNNNKILTMLRNKYKLLYLKMGNQIKADNQSQYQIHDRLNFVKIIEHIDQQSGDQLSQMQIKRSLQHQKIIQAWNSQIMRIDDTQSRQILLLPKKYAFQKQGMCGSSGIIYITYDNLSYVLEGQIKNRFKLNRFFLQTQIWYLLYNVIRAGNKFQRIKRKVGNIHPNNILINDDGQIKIICSCSLPEEKDNFQLMVQNANATVFLAPQQFVNNSISRGQYPSSINPCLAQIFSIGMTILSAGTLLTCDDIYDKGRQSIKVNTSKIQGIFKYFHNQYSQSLSNLVSQMISVNPKDRKSASQIYDMLYQYEDEILQLQPFQLNNHRMIQTQMSEGVITKRAQLKNQQNSLNYPSIHGSIVPNQNLSQNINGFMLPNSNLGKIEYSSNIHQQPPAIVHSQFPQLRNSMIGKNSLIGNEGVYSNYMPQSNHYVIKQSGLLGQQYYNPLQNQGIKQSKFSGSQCKNFIPSNVNVVQSNYIPNYQFRQ